MKQIFLFLAAGFIALTSQAQTTKWNYDKSHSKVEFSVAHMTISNVMGKFDSWDGSFVADKPDFSDAHITFTIDASSINTDEVNRDKHLKSPDFFNIEKFPKIQFDGLQLKKAEGKNYKLIGNLTMIGVTRSVTLDVVYAGTIKDPYGNTRAGFKISGTLDRSLWGLKYNSVMDSGGLLIGNDVDLIINMELVKAK